MSTSGSWNFSCTASNVIQTAYEDLKVIEPGGTVSSADSVMALDRLNKLVKQLQGRSKSELEGVRAADGGVTIADFELIDVLKECVTRSNTGET